MPRSILGAFAGAVFALFLLVPSALFLEFLPLFWAWVIFSAALAGLALGVPLRLEFRGLLVIVVSVFCATGGTAYAEKVAPGSLWAVKLFAEIFFLVGSGIGGNYMATALLRRNGKGCKA